jgi:integrase
MRPRKHNLKLPPCVYLRHGSYYLVRKGKWERLGRDLSTALAEYGRRLEPPKGAMAALIDEALPVITKDVAKATAAQYRTAAGKLKGILEEFSPEQVLPKHVARIKRAMAGTPNMANRCLTVLRLVFHYAVEEQIVDSNPAVGITRLAEGERERLISIPEFLAIYEKAGPRLQVIMDLLLLTGQRVTDVLGIRLADLKDDGIYFRQRKTDARLVVRWSPELESVVERAKGLPGKVQGLTQLQGRKGKPVDYRSVQLQWSKACRLAGVQDADLRDLRAMSATMAQQQEKNPTALLGHTSPAMTARYLRSKKIPRVDGVSFGHFQNVGQKRNTEQ